MALEDDTIPKLKVDKRIVRELVARYTTKIPSYQKDVVGDAYETSYYQLCAATYCMTTTLLLYEAIPKTECLSLSNLVLEIAKEFQEIRTKANAVSDAEEFRNLSLELAKALVDMAQ